MVVDGLSFKGEWMDLLTSIVAGQTIKKDLVLWMESFDWDLITFVVLLQLEQALCKLI